MNKVITINNVNYQLFQNPTDGSCEGCTFQDNRASCRAACEITDCNYGGKWKEIQADEPAVTPIANPSGSTFVYDKHYQTLILSRDNQEVQRMQVQPHELQTLLQFLSDVKLSDLIVDSSNNS